jgi:hypothetical protein
LNLRGSLSLIDSGMVRRGVWFYVDLLSLVCDTVAETARHRRD